MFSLRSISLVALACAAITSAAPANVARQLNSLPIVGNVLGAVQGSAKEGPEMTGNVVPTPKIRADAANVASQVGITSAAYHHPNNAYSEGGGSDSDASVINNIEVVERANVANSLPRIFHEATVALGPVVAELKADVAIAAKVDVKVLAEHLGAVVEILEDVVAEVQVVVVGGAYLTFEGVVYTAETLAVLVCELIKLVVIVLHVVVGVVGFVDVVLGPLIIRIGALLVDIIVCVVAVIDIKVALAVLVKDIVADITFLQYVGILAALNIKA